MIDTQMVPELLVTLHQPMCLIAPDNLIYYFKAKAMEFLDIIHCPDFFKGMTFQRLYCLHLWVTTTLLDPTDRASLYLWITDRDQLHHLGPTQKVLPKMETQSSL
jgi:hypothetical protein